MTEIKAVKAKKETKPAKVKGAENPMRKVKIERIVVSCGGVDKELEKSTKLLALLTGMKIQIIQSTKRIPDFGVRPGLEVGARATLRGRKGIELLKRLLGAEDNILKAKSVAENHLSFGIKEYIEIPGMEYQREIGIRGLNVAIVFTRAGMRVKIKKIKSGRVPKRQYVSKEEIIKFMEDNFKTKFK